MTAADVTGVLVTRGDVDVEPILESWLHAGIEDAVVWDNSRTDQDLAVYGRYAALAEARNPVVLVQDDDVILPPASIAGLVGAYQPGVLVANMPARFRHDFYRRHCLVGFGAIFDRQLPERAFARFERFDWPLRWRCPEDLWKWPSFYSTCDVVFSALTPWRLLDLPYQEREFASAPGRMWTTPGHQEERQRMLDLALRLDHASRVAS